MGPILAFVVGFGGTLFAWWLVKRDPHPDLPPVHPFERSLSRVPATVVSTDNWSAQLRATRKLFQDLTSSERLWLESREESERWLTEYDQPGSDEQQLLKRAYLILHGIEAGHRAMPSLDQTDSTAVTQWLNQYLGTEERA